MARFRLSRPAESDLAQVLTASAQRWGPDGMRRYAAPIAAAMRRAAAQPNAPATRDRSELFPGLRSLHLRHVRVDDPKNKVRQPMHVLYFRSISPNMVEIVRMLHDRMGPSRHIDPSS
jgi:toxin ParE1/3/4